MKKQITKEIVPLTPYDCYTVFRRVKSDFDFPLHFHEEYELNFIYNAAGAQRVIGDHMEEIGQWELVLVGSNLQHAWFMHNCSSKRIQEITVQFHKDLFDDNFMRRNQFSMIKNLLDRSARGILFSQETAMNLNKRIESLISLTGFDSMLELLSILNDLSLSRNMRVLSATGGSNTLQPYTFHSRRIEKAINYMKENFRNPIRLSDVSKAASMSEVAFSRFFKQKTGSNFIDSLTDIRIGHACRMLIDTTHSVTEIAYGCGFNNISNFNRIFRKKKGYTPKQFRSQYLENGVSAFF
jgi:AraC-like DNA-binding protein